MEVLEGARSDFTVYTVEDHIYRLMKTFKGRKYFLCLKKTCKASYVVNEKDGSSKILEPHNHSSDKILVEKYKFLTALRRRARCENVAPRTLYAECLLGLSDEAVERIGGFERYKKIIYNAKSCSPSRTERKKEIVMVEQPEFLILDGARSDTKVHLCNDFLYHYRKSFNRKKYFNCIQKSCQAKLIQDKENGTTILTKTHNHPSDELTIEYYKFLTLLRSRARSEKTNPRILFNSCLQGLSKEAVDKFGCYEKYKKILYRARSSCENFKKYGNALMRNYGGEENFDGDDLSERRSDFEEEEGSEGFDFDYEYVEGDDFEEKGYEEIVIEVVSDDDQNSAG